MVKRAAFLLLLCACSKLPSAKRADFSKEGIEARIDKLRPSLEAALGGPLGPVEVKVCEPDLLAKLLTAQIEQTRSNFEGGPRGDALHTVAEQEATQYSLAVLGYVDASSGVLHICPRNFDRMGEISKSWRGIASQGGLDIILIHELVHIWQHKQFNLLKFLGTPRSMDELFGLVSAIEGHAQRVTRAVARRRGLDRWFRLLVAMQTEVPPDLEDESTRHLVRLAQATASFSYAEGLKFWDAITKELGEKAATKRIFENPPRTTDAISRPETYLDPETQSFDLEAATKRVRRYVKEVTGGDAQVVPVLMPTIRALLALGGEETANAADGVIKGAVIMAKSAMVSIVLCRGAAAAKRLSRASPVAQRARIKLMQAAGDIHFEAQDVTLESRPATHTRTVVMMGEDAVVVDQIIVARGDLYFEVVLYSGGLARTRRMAVRILKLVQGVRAPSPWKGLEGDAKIDAFAAALDHKDWGVRWRATRNLGRRFKKLPKVGPHLLRALKDKQPSVRLAALKALGHARAPAVAKDPDWEVRRAFIKAVAGDDTLKGKHRFELVKPSLSDDHVEVRLAAAEALRELDMAGLAFGVFWLKGEEAPYVITADVIGRLLKEDDPRLRRAAIVLVHHVGNSKPFGQFLYELLDDEDAAVRAGAATQIARYPDIAHESVPKLTQLLHDERRNVRRRAVAALEKLGERAAYAVQDLIELLDDNDLGDDAADALAAMGKAAAPAREALIKQLDAKQTSKRITVARTLWKLEYDVEELLPVAAAALKGDEWYVRSEGIELLGEIGESAHKYIPELIEALADKKQWVRDDAAETLGKFGSAAKSALPALRKLLKDREKMVQRSAREAIKAIEGG